MNRHARRAAAARNRRRHSSFYRDYIQYLPRVQPGAPFERGRVYHAVFFHDEWCRFYETERLADCNCQPVITRHIEPRRS